MHRLVMKVVPSFTLILLVLLFVQVSVALAASSSPFAWTPWSYHNAPTVSIPGGTLKGSGATRWADDASFTWQIDSNTNSSYAGYQIEAAATGYDRCSSSNPWTERMSTDYIRYNTSYTNAGAMTGYYFDCGQGGSHSYRNSHQHTWWQRSGSVPYSTSGTGYY